MLPLTKWSLTTRATFVGGHFNIGDFLFAGFEYFHNGFILAHADATGLRDRDIFEFAAVDLFHKAVEDRARACGDAAGRHADDHSRDFRVVFPQGHFGFRAVSDGVEFFNSFHSKHLR
jgi:hypothetical protein